jgi:hypothetical protein
MMSPRGSALQPGNGHRPEKAPRAEAAGLGQLRPGRYGANEYDEIRSGLWTRGLLIRRNIADGDLTFFSA